MKLKGIRQGARGLSLFWRGSGEFIHLLLGVNLIFLWDQLLKHSIDREPEENFPRELPYSKGKVKIERAHNPGFSQGHFQEFPEFVRLSSLALTAFATGVLQVFCTAFPGKRKVEKLGAMLLLGGAVSNTYDRVAHGFVTDFLHIQVGALKKSIINIGDIAIVSGMCIYFLGALGTLLRGKER